ncbi:histidine phosphatase family protein [Corynebacterium urogenitale]
MSHVYLVRHGQTTSNEIQALDTALPGADLTPLGCEQAKGVGSILAQRTSRLHVISSQAARAQQTAALLAATYAADGELLASGAGSAFSSRFQGVDLSPLSDSTAVSYAGDVEQKLASIYGVSEIPAGDLEMKNDHESHVAYHRVLATWLQGDTRAEVPGGSTGQQVMEGYVPQLLALMLAAQQESADTGGETADIALVSHGAVIRLIARFLGAIDPEFAFHGYLRNSHFIQLEVPENLPEIADNIAADFEQGHGAFTVVEWGEHGRPVVV